MKKVQIFSDGACSGNPGPGGWGTILRFGEHEKEMAGPRRFASREILKNLFDKK